MINAMSNAVYGLRSSAQQFEKAAKNVVSATAPATGNAAAPTSASSESGDLATAIVDTKQSALSFKASTAVFRTADKMMGELLDTIA